MKKMRWLFVRNFGLRRFLKLIKLSVFLLLVSMHLAVADVGAQAKITIGAGTVTYWELFNQIKKQTGLTVVYSNNELDKHRTVEAGFIESDLRTVLDKILTGTRLTYEIMDEFIVLKVVPEEKKNVLNIVGQVTDKNKVPLPGVTVIVKGSNLGTATDQEGRYRLNIPEIKNLSLLFSFIGMKTREVVYTGKDTINVVMEEEVAAMDEVVVTGIYERKRSDFTGSASTFTAEKLKEVMEYHNFQLVNYYKAEAVDYQKVLDDTMAVADILTSMVVDVSDLLDQARQRGDFVMFEGAQGTLLDIDHGTYPYVTSSNTTAGGVATGSGLGPRYVDYVLGILKAYSTRVGAGPFPTELFDETGEFLCKQGNEFGATTGRRRRTGWLDTVAVRRAVQLNSLSGFCLTKLDVLDGLKEVKLCVAYRMPDGREVTTTPLAADDWKGVEPIYETMPGWSESTFGVKDRSGLPQAALNYIKRIEELTGVPIDIISTGPDRTETMILRDPFDA